MKKLFLILVTAILLASCGSEKGFEDNMLEHNEKLLVSSLNSGDFITALTATQTLLLYDTGNVGLYDTLYQLFVQTNNQQGVLIATKKVISANPADTKALEHHASAAKKLKIPGEIITTYQKLFEIEPDTRYLYEIAVQYYQSNNPSEGEKYFSKAVNSPRGKSDMITVLYNNQRLQVPVLPAIYNYLGVYNELNGKIKDAMTFYGKALEIYPNYIIAKNNINKLKGKK